MLCDHLEEWEGDARGRRYGDICICIADTLCYKGETNKHTIVKQLYSNKDVKNKNKLQFCKGKIVKVAVVMITHPKSVL